MTNRINIDCDVKPYKRDVRMVHAIFVREIAAGIQVFADERWEKSTNCGEKVGKTVSLVKKTLKYVI
jgi:capsid protein